MESPQARFCDCGLGTDSPTRCFSGARPLIIYTQISSACLINLRSTNHQQTRVPGFPNSHSFVTSVEQATAFVMRVNPTGPRLQRVSTDIRIYNARDFRYLRKPDILRFSALRVKNEEQNHLPNSCMVG